MRDAVLVVVYSEGSALPIELAADADGYQLIFAAPVGWMRPGLRELLEALGDVVDMTDEEAGVAELRARAPVGIVSFADPDLPLAARLARRLGLRYHSEEVVRGLTDKFVQRQRLDAAGLRVPRFRVIDRAEQLEVALAEVGTPAVLKPIRGAGSRQVYRLEDPQQALRHATDAFASGEAEQFLLEEMLIGCPGIAGIGFGDYVSCELLLWRGEVAYHVVNGRLPLVDPFRERGFLIPAPLAETDAAEVCRVSAAACAALGVCDGWVDIELKLTADGPVVIEVNGRLGGYVAPLLYRSFGVEAVRLAFETAAGRQPQLPVCEPVAVAFSYQILPPVGDWRLASWGDIMNLTEHPEIRTVVLHAQPGDRVDWRQGSLGTIGVIEGSVERTDAVLQAVRTIEDEIAAQVSFSPA